MSERRERPYPIALPEGVDPEGLCPTCDPQSKSAGRNHVYNCLGSWTEWRGSGYYERKCVCPCTGGKSFEEIFYGGYADNPDELEAVLPLMPVYGDRMRQLVEDYKKRRDVKG